MSAPHIHFFWEVRNSDHKELLNHNPEGSVFHLFLHTRTHSGFMVLRKLNLYYSQTLKLN